MKSRLFVSTPLVNVHADRHLASIFTALVSVYKTAPVSAARVVTSFKPFVRVYLPRAVVLRPVSARPLAVMFVGAAVVWVPWVTCAAGFQQYITGCSRIHLSVDTNVTVARQCNIAVAGSLVRAGVTGNFQLR